jgi:hypothetical protein
VIDGVLNSSAAAPGSPAGSKQKAASQRLSKRTATLFNAITPGVPEDPKKYRFELNQNRRSKMLL